MNYLLMTNLYILFEIGKKKEYTPDQISQTKWHGPSIKKEITKELTKMLTREELQQYIHRSDRGEELKATLTRYLNRKVYRISWQDREKGIIWLFKQ